ncbi:hypothetical protein ARMGADRAFT_1033830 [Armillaria gallica]|uniref:Uncharacterized protein n=1 Tax=Armillaria gallica TaxID=47427 RepID=A0A2H3DN33_ARMGA|nr:hypothetical protein ARMGADRAFT_1033830 [Armillaria gallica]
MKQKAKTEEMMEQHIWNLNATVNNQKSNLKIRDAELEAKACLTLFGFPHYDYDDLIKCPEALLEEVKELRKGKGLSRTAEDHVVAPSVVVQLGPKFWDALKSSMAHMHQTENIEQQYESLRSELGNARSKVLDEHDKLFPGDATERDLPTIPSSSKGKQKEVVTPVNTTPSPYNSPPILTSMGSFPHQTNTFGFPHMSGPVFNPPSNGFLHQQLPGAGFGFAPSQFGYQG